MSYSLIKQTLVLCCAVLYLGRLGRLRRGVHGGEGARHADVLVRTHSILSSRRRRDASDERDETVSRV